MKSFNSLVLLNAFLIALVGSSMVGCGGSGEPAAVTDNADAAALAEYDRLDAEAEEAANNDGSED